jgi:hypothetical protein
VSRTVRGVGDNAAVLGMFRRQLADIDTDLAQGRLLLDEAAAARASDSPAGCWRKPTGKTRIRLLQVPIRPSSLAYRGLHSE